MNDKMIDEYNNQKVFVVIDLIKSFQNCPGPKSIEFLQFYPGI